jgi:predicted membrane GTPase involved in stress response
MELEFPLEQKVRNPADAFQLAFARRAMALVEESEELRRQASHQGLLMLGNSEASLRVAVEILRDRYGDSLEIERPRVRYVSDGTLQQPIMELHVFIPLRYLGAVRRDLEARRAVIAEIAIRHGVCAIDAAAPLARLLGYAKALDRLTAGTGDHSMRLLRYAPVSSGPGDDAA